MSETRDLLLMPIAREPSPYGTLIPPTEDATAFGPQDAALELGAGIPRFYTMRLLNRPCDQPHHPPSSGHTGAEFGRRLIWLLTVAPPPNEDFPDAEPSLHDIRAFRVPPAMQR
jgi:hypothetical protein